MRRYTLQINGKEHVIDVEELTSDSFRVYVESQVVDVQLSNDEDLAQTAITPGIEPHQNQLASRPASISVARPAPAPVTAPASNAAQSVAKKVTRRVASGAAVMSAPMPGVILTVDAKEGMAVKRGDVLLVLEAMKMKNLIKATRDGVIAEVYVHPDQPVGHGDPLLRFEEG